MTEPKKYNSFSGLSEEIRQKLDARMTQITLLDGECAYRRNEDADALYQVVSGKIKVSNVSKDGKELLYLVFEEGDCFGEVGLLDFEPRAHNALSSGTTILKVLKKNDFDVLLAEHPEILKPVARVLCTKLHTVFEFFENRALLPLPKRLANRIYELGVSEGGNTDNKLSLDIELSQMELAHMMGASRQAVGKVLKLWESQNLIRIHYGKITIVDLLAIEEISEME